MSRRETSDVDEIMRAALAAMRRRISPVWMRRQEKIAFSAAMLWSVMLEAGAPPSEVTSRFGGMTLSLLADATSMIREARRQAPDFDRLLSEVTAETPRFKRQSKARARRSA